MECNKDGAIQAREVAERKLVVKDYKAAKKFSLKAQTLFPNLENLTQLLTVCDVHCSAENKINGETDWYGVLQVATTADELAIKKQYRKLALLLHPDKNKFPGAEAAFKLIGEANTILTDKGKRSLHDVKRSGRNNINPQIRRPPQTAHQTGQTGQQTFWTICTSCGMRYQHFRSVYKRALRCQNCMQTFVAYDINEQPVRTQNPNPNPMYSFNRPNGSVPAGSSANPFQRPSPIFTQFQPGVGTSTGMNESSKFEKVNLERAANSKPSPASASFTTKPPTNPPKSNPPKRTQPQKKKRKRVVEEDEEEESEAESSDSEEEIVLPKEVKVNGMNDPPRRSSRRKNDVKYNEKDTLDEDLDELLEGDDVSDDDDDEDVLVEDDDVTVTHTRKRLRKESDKEKDNKSVPTQKETEEKEEEIKSGSEAEKSGPETEKFEYSDSEFFSFETLRSSNRFTVGQVWALYDSLDGMPRFYALIKQVRNAPSFLLKFIWLESNSGTRSAKAWIRADLPVAVGNFIKGSVESTDEILMFSHEVDFKKGAKKRGAGFEILPQRGEIWAVFRNWDENWSADPEAHGKESFEYEIVEVLGDFVGESDGFMVSKLVRMSGFLSVFVREKENASFVVKESEILRFSHRIPAYRMNGQEREKVPVGAFELDQASLPSDLDKAFGSVELDLKGNGNGGSKEKEGGNGEKKEKLNGNLSNEKAKEKLDESLDGNSKKKPSETSGGDLKRKLSGTPDGSSKKKLSETSDGKSKEKLSESSGGDSKMKLSETPDGKSKEKPNETTDGNLKKKLSETSGANSNKKLGETSNGKSDGSSKAKLNGNSNSGKSKLDEKINEKSNEKPSKIPDKKSEDKPNKNSIPDTVPEPSEETLVYTYSEPEFYSFTNDREIQKFQPGQIWALYSDVDQFPKFYGWVRRVDPSDKKVHIRWLEPVSHSLSEEAKRWAAQEIPIGCGTFDIKGSTVSYCTNSFSHLVSVTNKTVAGGKRIYEIFPRKDEIWAIYRNWTAGWKVNNMKDGCQYDLVEVLEVSEKGIEVHILEKVDGHKTVFARDTAKKPMIVPRWEYVKFSHRIPSYKLKKEDNLKFSGCVELDSASVPEHLLE